MTDLHTAAPEWRAARDFDKGDLDKRDFDKRDFDKRDFDKRDVAPAMTRGAKGRCPACGQGKLFYKYLKVNPACPACDEELSHHRADDMPAYIVVSIVGHVVLFGLMLVEAQVENFNYLTHLLIWPALALVMSLLLLPPVKGALIGLQWALRMHGFGGAKENQDA